MILVLVCLAAATAVLAGPASPPPQTPKLLDAGKAAYGSTCLPCHGASGEGNGPVAFAIKPPPRNFVKDKFKNGDSAPAVFDTITNGLPNTKMVGYPQLSDSDRWGIAYYVLSLRTARK